MGNNTRAVAGSNSVSYCKRIPAIAVILAFSFTVNAQSAFKGLESLFTTPEHYVVYHTDHPPVIDGNINELAWQQVNWTGEFVDIEGKDKPRPAYATRVKLLWDDSCLYIAAELAEPQLWATLKQHDEIVFHDNDFEFFIDPGNTGQPYFEVEVNPYNTIFDLLLTKPYRDGGIPVSSWDAGGLRSAVKMQGTLNNPSDQDQGWTVEMAVPFKALSVNFRSGMPKEGSIWRMNFSRVEWDTKVADGKYVKLTDGNGKPLAEHNWVWSPQGVINMHYPERWGYLQFSRQAPNSATFNLPFSEMQKRYLWLIYYRQKKWYSEHRTYAFKLVELGVDEHVSIDKKENALHMEASDDQFTAFIKDNQSQTTWAIDQSGLLRQIIEHPHE